MKSLKMYSTFAFACLLIAAFLYFVSSSLHYKTFFENGTAHMIYPISNVTYQIDNREIGRLSLPNQLTGLEPRTIVTLSATIEPQSDESILIKSVFAPLKLYLNDVLYYEYGQAGTFPAYMNDPPTNLAMIKLPDDGGIYALRVEYTSLTQRNTLALPIFLVGESTALTKYLFQSEGISMLFSFILIFLGIVMVLIFLTIVRKIPSGTSFLWLGLFSISVGIWVLGECDLAAFLVPYPTLLYTMAYVGLFFLTIPFLKFGLVVLAPHRRTPFKIMLWAHYLAISAAFLLQLTGQMDFTKSLYWFHMIGPIGFITFAVSLLIEHFKNHNPAAKRFGPAILLLTAFAILELINYWFNLTGTLTLFFQLGVLAFVLSLGIASGYYIQESIRIAAERERLQYQMTTLEHHLNLQRLQYQKIAENNERVKAQRHDLRHQLTVLRSLALDSKKLNAYIDELLTRIPTTEGIRLCENYAVNSVTAYYYAMAKELNIDISVALAIPEQLTPAVESDLCVLLGNLMENAIEACERIEHLDRFIHIQSVLTHDTLTIAVDNSFDARLHKNDGVFLSSKRSGKGMGISSISAVAKKYNGNAVFEESSGVFKASVYLNLPIS